MKYLGGKSKISKKIAKEIRARTVARGFWDPFCGGLSMSVALSSEFDFGIYSDAFIPLISLYDSALNGWDIPESVSEDDYRKARDLTDTDPMKAFCGFGCSFGGKWFGGYARSKKTHRNFAAETRRSLVRDLETLERNNATLGFGSFMEVDPIPLDMVLYLDPPYEGTTGYGFNFDHRSFWRSVSSWRDMGADVFVSEYNCDLPSEIVWEKDHVVHVSGGSGRRSVATERLFKIL